MRSKTEHLSSAYQGTESRHHTVVRNQLPRHLSATGLTHVSFYTEPSNRDWVDNKDFNARTVTTPYTHHKYKMTSQQAMSRHATSPYILAHKDINAN
jgi:hypothetical protein